MSSQTILIIEDDESIRDSVEILLESEGFSVLKAASGEQGLSMLTDNTDLVILDIMLPILHHVLYDVSRYSLLFCFHFSPSTFKASFSDIC
ncbi:Response regulator receiver domain-containing protein [Butyrivibrio sp. ob235]|uniref:response regulator n=1 Tax=Butyrivibrio sp. ob235 TaxID=1761780 RepID=UPI0008B6729C|nr:response regulator [Butyrivibrio sp. ob235]SEL14312.1 Response regulator receiver domain-containing protein [Butyrivibrio sp. ob235]